MIRNCCYCSVLLFIDALCHNSILKTGHSRVEFKRSNFQLLESAIRTSVLIKIFCNFAKFYYRFDAPKENDTWYQIEKIIYDLP